jgi:hypothetical protein
MVLCDSIDMKNNNNISILTLIFCPCHLVMPLLATLIGARLEIILWMATGSLLIAGLTGAVAFLDSHAGLRLMMAIRQTILREGCSPQASRRPRPEKESGGGSQQLHSARTVVLLLLLLLPGQWRSRRDSKVGEMSPT